MFQYFSLMSFHLDLSFLTDGVFACIVVTCMKPDCSVKPDELKSD
jgi:hypothetical protein